MKHDEVDIEVDFDEAIVSLHRALGKFINKRRRFIPLSERDEQLIKYLYVAFEKNEPYFLTK